MNSKYLLFTLLSSSFVFGINAAAEDSPLLQDSPKELNDYVTNHARPLKLSEIVGDAKVVFFGETHTETNSKKFLASRMSILKDLGFTHLGLEMFSANQQQLLNDYENGKASDEQILIYLKKYWDAIYGLIFALADWTNAFNRIIF